MPNWSPCPSLYPPHPNPIMLVPGSQKFSAPNIPLTCFLALHRSLSESVLGDGARGREEPVGLRCSCGLHTRTRLLIFLMEPGLGREWGEAEGWVLCLYSCSGLANVRTGPKYLHFNNDRRNCQLFLDISNINMFII